MLPGRRETTKTKTKKGDAASSASRTGSYASPPWTFTGKALYQLSLVRVSDARKYVPESIPLVNIFGWTLGGFYLARYDGSPAGQFDELVALAGLAWNFPTSCAWAARVYVNSDEARRHGLAVVGLPSRLASFERRAVGVEKGQGQGQGQGQRSRRGKEKEDWWGPVGSTNSNSSSSSNPSSSSSVISLYNTSKKKRVHVCSIDMASSVSDAGSQSRGQFMPSIQMFLPSFSGATALCPEILKYSLRLETKVRFLRPMRVLSSLVDADAAGDAAGEADAGIEAFVGRDVLGGRPLVCMSFEDMVMEVQKPEVVNGNGTMR